MWSSYLMAPHAVSGWEAHPDKILPDKILWGTLLEGLTSHSLRAGAREALSPPEVKIHLISLTSQPDLHPFFSWSCVRMSGPDLLWTCSLRDRVPFFLTATFISEMRKQPLGMSVLWHVLEWFETGSSFSEMKRQFSTECPRRATGKGLLAQ